MTKETYFGELSFALRRRELLPRPVEERGAARYDPTWVDTDGAKATLA